MSKRKNYGPTEFTCPGCQEMFDAETHIPFVGSCGDSMCSVCLNEKKIKNCPECNLEGAFACKQKNKLAMKFLSAAAENEASNSKRPKLDIGEETKASDEPVPAILDPNNRHFLAQIVNQLDPGRFVRLARTCRYLHNYCFNSNDVKITYDIYSMTFRYCFGHDLNYRLAKTKSDEKPGEYYFAWDYAGYKYGFLSSADARNRLKNYPFAFKLEELRIETGGDVEFFESLFIFLAQFPVKTIEKVCASLIRDGKGFMKLLRDFHVKQVKLDLNDLPEDILDEFGEYAAQNLNSLHSVVFFPEHLIPNLSMPTLNLSRSQISKDTVRQLVMKWADSTDDFEWLLSSYPFDFDIEGLFAEILPFYHKGPISAERPLAFVKKNKHRKFYMLRKDGKVIKCSISFEQLWFVSESPSYYPPCLLPDSNDSKPEYDSDDLFDDFPQNQSESDGHSDDEPEPDGDSDNEPESEDSSGDESND